MCRSIKRLREPGGGPTASDDEIREAALQYVRKVSGFREPSARHADAFTEAVDQVARASKDLLSSVTRTLRA